MEYSDLVKSMKGMPLQLGKQSISLQSQSENSACYFVQRKLPEIFQTTTVVEFQSTFEEVMNNETWISEPLRISLFISGLKPELRRKLLFNRPASLMEAYSLARAYGARMDETKNSSPSEVLSCTSANFFVTQSMKIEETQLGARSGLCAETKSIPRFSQAYSTQLNLNSQPIIQNLTSGNPNTPAINPKNSPSAIKSETQDCPINTPKQSHQTTLLPANNLSVHRLSTVELCEIKEKSDTLYTNYDQNHSPIHKCRRRFPLSLGNGDDDRDYSNHQSKWVPPVRIITTDTLHLNILVSHFPKNLHSWVEAIVQKFRVLLIREHPHDFIESGMAERFEVRNELLRENSVLGGLSGRWRVFDQGKSIHHWYFSEGDNDLGALINEISILLQYRIPQDGMDKLVLGANQLFEEMLYRNVSHWNSLISGYANVHMERGITVFNSKRIMESIKSNIDGMKAGIGAKSVTLVLSPDLQCFLYLEPKMVYPYIVSCTEKLLPVKEEEERARYSVFDVGPLLLALATNIFCAFAIQVAAYNCKQRAATNCEKIILVFDPGGGGIFDVFSNPFHLEDKVVFQGGGNDTTHYSPISIWTKKNRLHYSPSPIV